MTSQVRQNFDAKCEELINNQINMELYASYTYLSMVCRNQLFSKIIINFKLIPFLIHSFHHILFMLHNLRRITLIEMMLHYQDCINILKRHQMMNVNML